MQVLHVMGSYACLDSSRRTTCLSLPAPVLSQQLAPESRTEKAIGRPLSPSSFTIHLQDGCSTTFTHVIQRPRENFIAQPMVAFNWTHSDSSFMLKGALRVIHRKGIARFR